MALYKFFFIIIINIVVIIIIIIIMIVIIIVIVIIIIIISSSIIIIIKYAYKFFQGSPQVAQAQYVCERHDINIILLSASCYRNWDKLQQPQYKPLGSKASLFLIGSTREVH